MVTMLRRWGMLCIYLISTWTARSGSVLTFQTFSTSGLHNDIKPNTNWQRVFTCRLRDVVSKSSYPAESRGETVALLWAQRSSSGCLTKSRLETRGREAELVTTRVRENTLHAQRESVVH